MEDFPICNLDTTANYCGCSPPCNSVCAFKECKNDPSLLVPVTYVWKDDEPYVLINGNLVEAETWVCLDCAFKI